MFAVTKLIGVMVVVIAAVLVSLGVFGVFSSHEIKDSLVKVVEVAAVVVVASVVIALINKK